MVATPQNTGRTLVRLNTGSGGSLETLGLTRNGADVSTEGFWIDVPGDENGGDSGPPIDIQYLPEMARVRIELTKYDQVVLDKVMRKINTLSKTPGNIGAFTGVFLFLNGYEFRLILDSPTQPRNFWRAVPRAPTQRNMGVRFCMKVLEFDCYPNGNGVLWDLQTS